MWLINSGISKTENKRSGTGYKVRVYCVSVDGRRQLSFKTTSPLSGSLCTSKSEGSARVRDYPVLAARNSEATQPRIEATPTACLPLGSEVCPIS
jgi:hypothetical protein